jgi:hypothetical protein
VVAAIDEVWESPFDLCQWGLPNDQPGACTNRTRDVFCAKHNREIERESRRRERDREIGAVGGRKENESWQR